MMISAEYHAMPRRYALGFDRDDFVDANGRPLTPWESVAGVLWATPKSPREGGVSVGQFFSIFMRIGSAYNYRPVLGTARILLHGG